MIPRLPFDLASFYATAARDFAARVAELQAREAYLREALAHYAEPLHWSDVTPGPEVNTAGYSAWEYDGGEDEPWRIARAALTREA